MILILAYWVLLFLIFLPTGILVKKICKLETSAMPLLLLFGMFFCTAYFTTIAFFLPLDQFAFLPLAALSAMLWWRYRNEAQTYLKDFRQRMVDLPLASKIVFIILGLSAALRSSQFPFVIDNESYYIQTIKWLTEYGIVTGLGNLHIFFAQTSPWHVLEAGLNLSFLVDGMNDINGFLFTVCISYFLTEANEKWRQHNLVHWIGLLPACSILLLLFVDSPSPDLPLFLVTPIILYLFTQAKHKADAVKAAFLLFIFIAFIKITIAPLGILFISFIVKDFKSYHRLLITAGIITVLWIAKNVVITGYPLYPFAFFSVNSDWTIPQNIMDFISAGATKQFNFKEAADTGIGDITARLINWLELGGLAGIMNKLMLVLLVTMPFLKKIRNNTTYLYIYFALLIHFISLLLTSPQFRFFLPGTLFFGAFIVAEVTNYFKRKMLLYNTTLIIGCVLAIALFFNVSTKSLTHNEHHKSTGDFEFSTLNLPQPNTRHPKLRFVKITEGNLDYFSPSENFFFYGTANGPLPCVNQKQIERFKVRFGVVPQMRGNDLANGFRSVKPEDIKVD